MATKLSGTQLQKMDLLGDAKVKWDRIRILVEKAATEERAREGLLRQCTQACAQLGRAMSNAGIGSVADTANELGFVAKRSGRFDMRLGMMRELVGKGYAGIDRAQNAVRDEAAAGVAAE